MPFGRVARPCRVFQYGCRQPLDGEEYAIQEMRGRVTFWNKLVEIEREHQSKTDQTLARLAPDVADTAAQVALLESDKEVDKGLLKAAWKAQREARKAAFARDGVKAALAELNEEWKEVIKEAYHNSGLYWPNYNDVLAAYRTARTRPGTLHFHAWRNEVGKLSMQWPKGLPVQTLLKGGDNNCQIVPVSEEAWTSPVRGKRRRLMRSVLKLRMGSVDRKTPIWLEIPIVLHRPLPVGGLVRSVSIFRERVGISYRWKATMTVELPDQLHKPAPIGRIALDVGWRKLPEGLRVAAWSDDANRVGQVVLPQSWLSEMGQVENIRSLRDQHFNSVKAALSAWFKAAPGVPEWVSEDVRTLHQWRSTGRLAGLVLRWRGNRFDGDEAGFEMAEAWRKRDLHLGDWEAHLRDQLITNRRERYRIFAARIAREYGEVVLEKFDLRKVAEHEQGAKDLPAEARHMRQWAAVSTLRLVIKNACQREGVIVSEVDAKNTTKECPRCGTVEDFDAASNLQHKCGACGYTRDQDLGAARVLLTR